MEQKIQYVEQFANETVDKCQDLVNHQHNRQQIDELKENNKQLKSVSVFNVHQYKVGADKNNRK